MEDFDIINEMLENHIKVDINFDEYEKGKAVLEEPRQYKINFLDIPKDVVIINIDKNFEAPSKLFKNSKRERHRADFAIIYCSKKIIFIVELKKNKGCHIPAQLLGAKCFVEYCKNIGREFWDGNFLKNYNYGFVRISVEARKRSTKVDREIKKTTAHEYKIIYTKETLYFRQLLQYFQ